MTEKEPCTCGGSCKCDSIGQPLSPEEQRKIRVWIPEEETFDASVGPVKTHPVRED